MVLQSLFSDLFTAGVTSVSYQGGVTAQILPSLTGGKVKVGLTGGNVHEFVLDLLHAKGVRLSELSFNWFDGGVLLTAV